MRGDYRPPAPQLQVWAAVSQVLWPGPLAGCWLPLLGHLVPRSRVSTGPFCFVPFPTPCAPQEDADHHLLPEPPDT